ncbi:hypothetical protein SUGI_1446720 [Cryptomeria japonica]|uniref:Uncharacterized protein n=1 Tax=Cryptomeria japonica TaxID=3369 RepID=A0AAD3NRK8_CRYJA|nr:hypothetical protein SUGI_0350780 [Cryptomeria japonica]GLJ58401.1 hypothetical protein SUGI_1446720 [Cryptomeria japonica]
MPRAWAEGEAERDTDSGGASRLDPSLAGIPSLLDEFSEGEEWKHHEASPSEQGYALMDGSTGLAAYHRRDAGSVLPIAGRVKTGTTKIRGTISADSTPAVSEEHRYSLE